MNQHPFVLFPAIDLLDGRSVRLRKGARASAEVVHADPEAQLAGYAAAGARWAHIVNLNAAFGDDPGTTGAKETEALVKRLVAQKILRLQVGGGVRTQAQAESLLALGVDRIVIGTWAVRAPEIVMSIARSAPERVVVGLDTQGDEVAVQGWTEASGLPVQDFGKRLCEGGVRHALYTQVERDGMLSGIDERAAASLARTTGLCVLASGGVRDITDIERLAQSDGVWGVIIGKALAAGTLALTDAIGYARSDFPQSAN